MDSRLCGNDEYAKHEWMALELLVRQDCILPGKGFALAPVAWHARERGKRQAAPLSLKNDARTVRAWF